MAAVWAGLMSGHANNSAAIAPTPSLTVTLARPHRATWPIVLQVSGVVAPWQEASVDAQIGGYQLVEVLVNVGDQVTKGQTLARFDRSLLQAEEARLEATDEQARTNEQRMLSLQKSGTVSDRDVLQFVTQAKTASASLASNRLQLRYADVLAPDDGVISARTATLGAVVPVGQELFRLIRQNRLEWRGEATAVQLAQIQVGQHVELTLPGGGEATATIRQMAPSFDPKTRLDIIYADIAAGSRAKAGMYIDGRVDVGQREATVVPAQSVTIRDGRSYVFRLLDAGTISRVSQRAVAIGQRRGYETQILEGVAGDDPIVEEGAGFLNDGDLVRIGSDSAGKSGVSP